VQSIAERLFAQNFVPGKGRSLRDDTLAADPTYEECGRLALDGLPKSADISGKVLRLTLVDKAGSIETPYTLP